ncbi:ankyrin repeat-containing domain protein [Flagelloscypha sp. PMI_526]|nr:ankyrin repeat-containing domain protein [Flagelloscypha sp. PMI_526]
MDDDLHRLVKNWLTPIDQTAKLNASIRARSSSTCSWLWDHPEVVTWRKDGGIFWCHAAMGTGKTIMLSHVADTLMKLPEECDVAYYYFEFTNDATLSEEALFRSIVSQLSHVGETTSRQFYRKHQNGSHQPLLSSLHAALAGLVAAPSRPLYIVIDALDEVPATQRKYLLESLLNLFSSAVQNVHVMMTSRDEISIHEMLRGKVPFDLTLDHEMVKHDIAVFIDQGLSTAKWQSWPKTDVQFIRDTLLRKADGMFRMVACQFEVLDRTQTTEDMLLALSSLPNTLSDTYVYILDTIPPQDRARAQTLFCILSAAFKPVSIVELSALLAVELGDPDDAENIPVYRDGCRYHQPHNIVGLGTALVCQTLSWHKISLQFAHASVKEFFIQPRISHWRSLDDHFVHVTTARACLAALIHNEDLTQPTQVADVEYTQLHWWKHISSYTSLSLLSQQQKLFQTFPWDQSSLGSKLRSWAFHPLPQTPLAFAAGAGLEQLLQTMLDENSSWRVDELNYALLSAAGEHTQLPIFIALSEKGGDLNSIWIHQAPLIVTWASSRNLQALQFLFEKGATMNIHGDHFKSALEAAANSAALNMVEFLVQKGRELGIEGEQYNSALRAALRAAAEMGAQDNVEFLVEKGEKANLRGGDYGPALCRAAKRGHLHVVKFLVQKGTAVDWQGESGVTPLQEAASWGHLDVAEFLLEMGADVNMQGGDYGSALCAAARMGHLTLVEVLVEKGAKVDGQGGNRGTALQEAALRGHLDIVEFLVKNGANVNMQGGGDYGSALKAAVQYGHLNVVEFLVEKGADVNMRAKSSGGADETALEVAAAAVQLDVVEFLREKGARLSDEDEVEVNMGEEHQNHIDWDEPSFWMNPPPNIYSVGRDFTEWRPWTTKDLEDRWAGYDSGLSG